MFPFNDMVMSLIETPFSRRSEIQKKQILFAGRPTEILDTICIPTQKTKTKVSSRSFNTCWYDTHKWLCGSFYKQRLFCWPCILLGKGKNVWITDGYYDLKNLARSVKMHEASKDHIHNFMGLVRLEKNKSTIADALSEGARLNKTIYNENVRKNRLILLQLIEVTLLLGKQELAFRGHDERSTSSNQGNFREVFNLLIKRNDELLSHYNKISNVFTGQSKTIQNEIIYCVYEYILDVIKSEINDAFFFSIISDDTTDIVEKSQCAITIRYVKKTGELKERFLGFYDVSSSKNAKSLFNLIITVLEPFNFKTKLIAQCYDGASVMAGHVNGLQQQIRNEAPHALFTHCCAHRLNLVLQQGSYCIPQSRIFFSTLLGISVFFKKSPKRTFVLDTIIGKRIPVANETRWCTRSKILNFVALNLNKLIEVMQNIMDNPESGIESINGAKGFINSLKKFDFVFFMVVFKEIFNITDTLYAILQVKHLDVVYCIDQVNTSINRIKLLRTFESATFLFNESKKISTPKQPRGVVEEDLLNKYSVLQYEILDNIITQLTERFQDLDKLKFVALVDSSKFKFYQTAFPNEGLECLSSTYKDMFDLTLLKNELSVVYFDSQFHNQHIQQCVKLLKQFQDSGLLMEVYKLFCLILTIPSTSVSVERNFSCLKRIKTYLRNSMTEERLSSLATISIEKELINSLADIDGQFYEKIIDRFSVLKDRRIDLIYKK